jgi:hypothetical protein
MSGVSLPVRKVEGAGPAIVENASTARVREPIRTREFSEVLSKDLGGSRE